LPERGYLREGAFADVVAFDPKTFRDQATFEKPGVYATGLCHLLVNGQPAIAAGKPATTLYGRVLRHGTA
jgi:N-acyl-D-aspartate/D-glutamate deacylase